jgi:hypothetical protein
VLHHERRTQFRARIVESPSLTDAQLVDTAVPRFSRCREAISYFECCELRHSMLVELERRPVGGHRVDWLGGVADGASGAGMLGGQVQKVVMSEPGV